METRERFTFTELSLQPGEVVWVTGDTLVDNFPTFVRATVTDINDYEHSYFTYPNTWTTHRQITLLLDADTLFNIDKIYKEKDLKKAKARVKENLKNKKEYLSTEIVALQNKCTRFKEHHLAEKERLRYKP